jgi:hypothetical protein
MEKRLKSEKFWLVVIANFLFIAYVIWDADQGSHSVSDTLITAAPRIIIVFGLATLISRFIKSKI